MHPAPFSGQLHLLYSRPAEALENTHTPLKIPPSNGEVYKIMKPALIAQDVHAPRSVRELVAMCKLHAKMTNVFSVEHVQRQ